MKFNSIVILTSLLTLTNTAWSAPVRQLSDRSPEPEPGRFDGVLDSAGHQVGGVIGRPISNSDEMTNHLSGRSPEAQPGNRFGGVLDSPGHNVGGVVHNGPISIPGEFTNHLSGRSAEPEPGFKFGGVYGGVNHLPGGTVVYGRSAGPAPAPEAEAQPEDHPWWYNLEYFRVYFLPPILDERD
ncbi:hypothetical protein I302_106066 [Kwoniella bestiolae CBS 10118]|uniref:Secreted protein n=1 Tax=Kwoniella bestiolae CBS 10118 TaxID=1296100 RepID=A0A1B9G2W9_9TREE|nr:hypothetical protein I302_05191 [Kwoniella bestiolae CBS 10118]OCF25372.1 hypothetical protein I302_05191 [Kwoniella bestiolae CBS 10118]